MARAFGVAPASRVAWVVQLAAAALLLPGCSSSGGLFGGGSGGGAGAGVTAGTDPGAAGMATGELAVYLETLETLISGDDLDRAATFNDVRDAAEFAPTRINRMLYALALSVPGHPGSDPEAAAARLRDILARSSTLAPEVRMLAEVQLETANELMVLEDAGRRFEQQLAEAEASRDAAYEEQLRQLRAENQALREDLEEARATLDAITTIERSLSEREDADE